MAIRLNLYCNKQIAPNRAYLNNFDQVNWIPGGVKRDALGIPISDSAKEGETDESKA